MFTIVIVAIVMYALFFQITTQVNLFEKIGDFV
mgnify:CR=1 FL=1|jgi:hypothetical protein